MKTRAFTLIELLIVVAIIGILAAIAVPNFLNASMKANISRNMADLRSTFNAIQMLRTEQNQMPIDFWDYETEEGKKILQDMFNNVGAAPGSQRSASMILQVLTSPISYMGVVPMDPFLQKKGEPGQGFEGVLDTYVYIDQDPNIPGDDMFFAALKHQDNVTTMHTHPIMENQLAIVAVGPDGQLGDGTVESSIRGLPYDPTNGLFSAGDIYIRCSGCFNN